MLAKTFIDPQIVFLALNLLGEILFYMDSLDQARIVYEVVLDYANECGDNLEYMLALEKVGRVL